MDKAAYASAAFWYSLSDLIFLWHWAISPLQTKFDTFHNWLAVRCILALLSCWMCHFQEMEKIAIELEEKRKEDEEKEKLRKQVKWTTLNLQWILTYFLMSCIFLWPSVAGDGKTETPGRRENQSTEWREEKAWKVRNVHFSAGEKFGGCFPFFSCYKLHTMGASSLLPQVLL